MTIDELNNKMNNIQKWGFTTGTAATAAAMGAAYLFINTPKKYVEVSIPYGIDLTVPIEYSSINNNSYSCGVIKYAGDDPDVTDGILISAKLEFIQGKNEGLIFEFFAGEGIGIVTEEGLSIKKGEAAINPVPRLMIKEQLTKILAEIDFKGMINITISAKDGWQIAKKTFNERLGIVGGISILGTSGLVMPMSKTALLQTIETDIKFRIKHSKNGIIYLSPGNIGAKYLENNFAVSSRNVAIISNFIGDSIDYSVSNGAKGIVICGDMGKLIKLSGGIMNTHSNDSDCRLELLVMAVFKYFYEINSSEYKLLQDTMTKILEQKTTTAAIKIIKEVGYENCFNILGEKMLYYAYNRAFKAEVFYNKNKFMDIEEFKAAFSINIIAFSNNTEIINTGDLK